jgi:ribosome assembly protein SQT1
MGVFAGHTSAVSCGGFTPDGRHVWSAGADASLRFWSPRTFLCLLSLSGGTFVRDAITSAAAGATYAVAGGDNGDLRIVFYRLEAADAAPAAKIAGTFTFDSSVETVAINHTETLVAAGLHNGSIVIIDCARMQQRCVMQHKDSVTQLLFHPSTDYALFSSAAALDCSIRFWDCRCHATQNHNGDSVVSNSCPAGLAHACQRCADTATSSTSSLCHTTQIESLPPATRPTTATASSRSCSTWTRDKTTPLPA